MKICTTFWVFRAILADVVGHERMIWFADCKIRNPILKRGYRYMRLLTIACKGLTSMLSHIQLPHIHAALTWVFACRNMEVVTSMVGRNGSGEGEM